MGNKNRPTPEFRREAARPALTRGRTRRGFARESSLAGHKRTVAAIGTPTGSSFGIYIHRITMPQDLGMCSIERDNFAVAMYVRG